MITELVIQAGVGMVLGYVVSLFVNAVVGAGSLVDLFSGLNLPASIDPLSLQQTKLFGQFYNMVLMALLFTTGAVIVIVEGFVKSFSSVGTSLPSVTLSDLAQTITGDVVSFFAAALEIAAPDHRRPLCDSDRAGAPRQGRSPNQRVRLRDAVADSRRY